MKKLNVLVVDDSAVMRAMIIRVLRLTGLSLGEIYEGANGEEGLRVLEDHPVDLALVDVNMPVMTGDEMLRKIRGEPGIRNLPVLVVTTRSSEGVVDERVTDAPILYKPFRPEELRDRVTTLMGMEEDGLSSSGDFGNGDLDF